MPAKPIYNGSKSIGKVTVEHNIPKYRNKRPKSDRRAPIVVKADGTQKGKACDPPEQRFTIGVQTYTVPRSRISDK